MMRMLLGLLASCGVLAWAAGGDPATGDPNARPASRPALEMPTATAPAGREARPMPGPRRRLPEAPGRRRAERPQPPAPPAEPLPPAKVDELMTFAQENFPQVYERLDRLRENRPEDFQRMLRKAGEPLLPIIEMKKRDQRVAQVMIDEYRLQMAITFLSERYRNAKSDEERTRLKTEIEKRISDRFDRHQERIRLEIDRLRSRLDEQERRLTDREQRKETLLRQELERLTRAPVPRPGPAPSEQRTESH